jgi:hypothetical protein
MSVNLRVNKTKKSWSSKISAEQMLMPDYMDTPERLAGATETHLPALSRFDDCAIIFSDAAEVNASVCGRTGD